MHFHRLLAKSTVAECPAESSTIRDSVFLPDHLQDVVSSNQAITRVVGKQMLKAVGLSDEWILQLEKITSLASWLHDLGKANSDFQKAIREPRPSIFRQQIRHEWVSVWFASQPVMKQWLIPAVEGCEKSWLASLCAIAGHHPKAGRAAPTDRCFRSEKITVLTEHDDFNDSLQRIQDWFRLDGLPKAQPLVYSGAGDIASIDRFMTMLSDLRNGWKTLKKDKTWKLLTGICKAILIGADVAGSALWEKIDSPAERNAWIKSSLGRVPDKADLDQIVKARLNGNEPHEFQKHIAASTANVTLVEAGCGSGKTVAAYMWAAQQHVGRRLWFCYPTTGTATEGFKGYLFGKFNGQDHIRADLFHSRKTYDLRIMLENPLEQDSDPSDPTIRVESLQAWDTQIVNCTVDNVLSLLQNLRQGLYAWPALANAAIVFDEVHCYDDILFGNLLAWLDNLVGIPVLLMTASLPIARRNAIREVCKFAGRTFEHIPNGSPKLENLPRYRQATEQPVVSPEACVESVANELSRNGRVLWISNTVDRTRKVGDVVATHSIDEPIYYHSRFIYKDRIERHSEVVELFENTSQPGFASTSQVAEMSLDLGYATLLVTELAPIPALIQRLGRLNRRANPETAPPVICDFLVIEPMNDGKLSPLPYEAEELELAKKWLKQLGQQPLAQTDLVRVWLELDKSEEIDLEKSLWLEGGIDTLVDSIRESSYGITVICNQHYPLAKAEGTAQYALPMNRPTHENWQAHIRPFRGFPIASDEAIDYDEKVGASWASYNIL